MTFSPSLKRSLYGFLLWLDSSGRAPALCKCTLFILNKHSAPLSNTSCVLRPFEDGGKTCGRESDWALSARSKCVNSFNTQVKVKAYWSVLPPSDLQDCIDWVIILTLWIKAFLLTCVLKYLAEMNQPKKNKTQQSFQTGHKIKEGRKEVVVPRKASPPPQHVLYQRPW